MEDFEIMSRLPWNRNQAIRKFMVDGVMTIGVQKDEQFSVKFNNIYSKLLHIKILLNERNVFSGQLSKPGFEPEQDKKLGIVAPGTSIEINAWPYEKDLVFTDYSEKTNLTVRQNVTIRGIIMVSLFTEDDKLTKAGVSSPQRDGLIKPVCYMAFAIRYAWWNDLARGLCRGENIPQSQIDHMRFVD